MLRWLAVPKIAESDIVDGTSLSPAVSCSHIGTSMNTVTNFSRESKQLCVISSFLRRIQVNGKF
jgi:hypothetical protein